MRHIPLSRFIILFIPSLETWLKKILETDSKSGRKSADSEKSNLRLKSYRARILDLYLLQHFTAACSKIYQNKVNLFHVFIVY